MRLFLLLLLIISIEVVLIAKVGSLIGFFYTFLLIISTAVIGSWQLKKQWRFVMTKMQTLQSEPSHALLEAFILLMCGILLITPGFLTDIIGFLTLIPRVRERLIVFLQQHSNHFTTTRFQTFAQQQHKTNTSERKAHSQVIEGEFERKDD